MPCGVASSGAGRAIGVQLVAGPGCTPPASSAASTIAIDKRPILRFPLPAEFQRRELNRPASGGNVTNATRQAARWRGTVLREARQRPALAVGARSRRRWPLVVQ